MPELPEVEAARSLAERYCPGRKIVEATVADDDKVINGIAPRDLEAALRGRQIVGACRKGKQLWLDMGQSSPALMLHFGMTGCLVVKGVDAVKYVNAKLVDPHLWPPKYCKIELELDDGTRLAFCDSRRFARANWQEDPLNNPPVSLLGYDILNDRPSAKQLSKALGKKRSAIKTVIMDQSVLAGVGNWVADEALHTARIHPCERACDLTEDQTEALRAAVLDVAEKSTEVDADSSRFPSDWLFSHRWTQKKAPAHLKFLTVGGRTTCYDPAVQKVLSPEATAGDEVNDEGDKGADQKEKAAKPQKAAKAASAAQEAESEEDLAEDSGAAKGAAKAGSRKQGKPTAKSRRAKPGDDNTEAAVVKPARKRAKRKA